MIKSINRVEGPGFELPGAICFLPVGKFKLGNAVDVSLIEAGSQEVAKIDWVFPAGAVQANKPLLSSAVGNLLTEGTTSKSALEIADTFDFYGAYLSTSSYYHNAVVTLFCLTKDLPDLLPLVEDVIKNPVFDDKEFAIYINKRRQEFLMDSEKVKTLAARKFYEVIFGPEHPYGRGVSSSDFDNITRDDLVRFHQSQYQSAEMSIVVAGQPGKNISELLNRYFGDGDFHSKAQSDGRSFRLKSDDGKFHLIEKQGALQSALRIGRLMFNNTHPDFIPLMVLNTILGGYFGSRLMTSVREEKGLTYGIGSSLISYKEGGVWTISSEVAGEMRDEALAAIRQEMIRLTTELVSESEMELVRNFMLGEMLRYFDGPFSSSDIYRTLQENKLDFDFYRRMEMELRAITPQRILSLAKKYLQPDDFYVVVAGK